MIASASSLSMPVIMPHLDNPRETFLNRNCTSTLRTAEIFLWCPSFEEKMIFLSLISKFKLLIKNRNKIKILLGDKNYCLHLDCWRGFPHHVSDGYERIESLNSFSLCPPFFKWLKDFVSYKKNSTRNKSTNVKRKTTTL